MTVQDIRVDHVTRVEGHGNIVATLRNGRIQEALFHVVEANRFFEKILIGRSPEEVAHIATRICGICAVSHCFASLQATENALGIEISQQTRMLRRLMMNGEQLSSHALHVYFLAAPDFLGLQSVLPLVKADPDTVRLAFRVKQTAYSIAAAVGGRHTHPIAAVPGGFTAIPSPKALEDLRDRLAPLREDMRTTIDLLKGLDIPAFERDTEYVSLRDPETYAFYRGDIVSSDAPAIPSDRYEEAAGEYVVPHATAKHAKWHRESYMVGALARVNNNAPQLHPAARRAMSDLGLATPCTNPFMNTVAQAVEMVHCIEDSLDVIDSILDTGLHQEDVPDVPLRAGRGIGAVEAPRGLLVHDYTYDSRGRCSHANCVIPTGQNLANLDLDMQAYLPMIKDRPREEIEKGLEMLVRAYDPCISCSAH